MSTLLFPEYFSTKGPMCKCNPPIAHGSKCKKTHSGLVVVVAQNDESRTANESGSRTAYSTRPSPSSSSSASSSGDAGNGSTAVTARTLGGARRDERERNRRRCRPYGSPAAESNRRKVVPAPSTESFSSSPSSPSSSSSSVPAADSCWSWVRPGSD